jgi:hypothetical protein
MRDKARHIVTVKRPPAGNHGTRGQKQGEDETIYAEWPCSIETLSGSEVELARQNFASASLKVSGHTDPKKLIHATDYLVFGARTLHVGFVNNIDQLGLEAELLCGEAA